MADSDQTDQYAFEDSVRATARMLWDEAALDGATKLDGRERDGVFETRDAIHIVEATVSTRMVKATEDAKKTHDAVLKLRRTSEKTVQGWLITKAEPTADQRDAARKYSSVRLMGFDQFRSLLFNGSEYLRARSQYRFGSIHDFSQGNIHVPDSEYVPVDFTNFERTERIPHDEIIRPSPTVPRRVLLLGEFGSGKSMALRSAFIERRRLYQRGERDRTPIYLNLRDHTGQSDPVEALGRHSRSVGYPGSSNDLVRAWRAGFVDLILDGFDEMATAGWGGSIQRVRHHRYVGMQLVRSFLEESPKHIDIFVAGRENFFDSMSEMKAALGINDGFQMVRTSEFSADDLKRYLNKKVYRGRLPSWLPARPLLISYLFAQGLIGSVDESQGLDEARGWHSLLDMIAAREAAQDSRLDPDTVRKIIERLAALARATTDGLGNLDITTIQSVFQAVAGFSPDEGAQQFLLRLPGLAPSSREDGSRVFVDRSLADSAKAGDVYRYVQLPFGDAVRTFESVASPIGSLGKAVLSARLNDGDVKSAQISRAIEIAAATSDCQQICSELIYALMNADTQSEAHPITIRSVIDDDIYFTLESNSISHVTFDNCLFSTVQIEPEYPVSKLPRLRECLIGTIRGVFGEENLPESFRDVEVGEYSDSIRTNADVFEASLPEPMKVLVSILRKLFLQSGSGRQESAFYRGSLDARSRRLVPEVLSKLDALEFAEPTRIRGITVWHPNRTKANEARSIIASPTDKRHELVKAVLQL